MFKSGALSQYILAFPPPFSLLELICSWWGRSAPQTLFSFFPLCFSDRITVHLLANSQRLLLAPCNGCFSLLWNFSTPDFSMWFFKKFFFIDISTPQVIFIIFSLNSLNMVFFNFSQHILNSSFQMFAESNIWTTLWVVRVSVDSPGRLFYDSQCFLKCEYLQKYIELSLDSLFFFFPLKNPTYYHCVCI